MISTTAQVNTFLKGMNLDHDISIIPDGEYRYAENVRIITNDGGTTGAIQNIEGVKEYTWLDEATDGIGENETVIGVCTIHKYGVIITVEGEGSDAINRVYRIEGFDSAKLNSTVVVKGMLGLCTNLEHTPNLSVIGNYENDSIVKIYFTDGNSSIKALNIVDGKYLKGTSLVDSDGNILNRLALDITPGAVLTPFRLSGLGSGNLPVGVVQYCYQLFNLRGSETTLSPMSELISLTHSSTNQGSQSYEGSYPGNSSAKSCTVVADLVTNDFDKCRIICVRYTTNNSVPQIVIVDEIDLTANQTQIRYTDTGNSYMGEITVDEFNNLVGYQFFAKSITKLQNRLFAANVTEDTWNPGWWDARAYRGNINGSFVLESGDTSKTIYGTFSNYSLSSIDKEHDCINPYNSLNFRDTTEITRYDRNANGELGGTGVNIEYCFVTAPLQLSEVSSTTRLPNNCSMNVPSKSMNGFTLVQPDGSWQSTVVFKDGTLQRTPNYADPYIAANYTGYQRDEVYRFGIIFYNNKSLPSPVYWIGDIRMPHASQLMPFKYDSTNRYLKGNALGIKFIVKNIPADAVAYEIVRCDRTEADRSVLMQSALSNLYEYRIQEQDDGVGDGESLLTSIELRPISIPTFASQNVLMQRENTDGGIQANHHWSMAQSLDRQSNYFKMISPEICTMQEDIEQYIGSASKLDFLYCLTSPIETTASSNDVYNDEDYYNAVKYRTRTLAAASSTLQQDGTIASFDIKSNWVGYTNNISDIVGDLLDGICFLLPWGVKPSSSSGEEGATDGGQSYFAGHVAKYFITATSVNSGFLTSNNIIQDAKYPPIAPYNSCSGTGAIPYRTNVGEKMFTNWNMCSFGQTKPSITSTEDDLYGDQHGGGHGKYQPVIGPGGPCLVIQTSNSIPGIGSNSWFESTDISLNTYDYSNALPIYNVKRSVIPYGGITYGSRQNSIYQSTGSFQLLESGTTTYANITFGGDTYLNVLDYLFTATFQCNDEKVWRSSSNYVGCYIPFESSINMNLFNGDMAHRTYTAGNYLDTHLQTDITQKGTYHVQDSPYYVYNPVYSSQNGGRQYVPASVYAMDSVHSSGRIYASQAKVNNEVYDNWCMFKVADYLDVDSQWGEITNLHTFKDKLFFFQDTALGIAAVNERALITDGNIGELTLGTGGILSRFDYLTTSNGSSVVNDRSITSTDTSIYWYDLDKNEICVYSGQVSQISKTALVQTYLNEMYEDKRSVTLGLFDKKYNELWFRFYDKSLIFNEQVNRFTSFYTFNPEWALTFSDLSVGIKGNKLYRLNTLDTDSTNGVSKNAKLTFVVNKDVEFTKTFDNVRLQGDFLDENGAIKTSDIILKYSFETKHQTTGEIENPAVDYREDSYRFAIPRQETNEDPMSYPARMRGKYLICNYEFEADGENKFKIPAVTTTYRYSLI